MPIEVFAPAKVNLTLHITGQRADGYHLLDSLIAFAPVGDQLRVATSSAMAVSVIGPEAAGVPTDHRNLVWRALDLMQGARFAVTLDKHLPAASGIGGGSSDAAAALRGALALAGHKDAHVTRGLLRSETSGGSYDLNLLALGADVPMCYHPRPVRVQGIGEDITPVSMPPLPAILVNPRVEVSTPQVFQALTTKTNAPSPQTIPHWQDAAQMIAWLAEQRNDLEPPAVSLQPVIGQVLASLREHCDFARMSGSGATCFGLCANPERAREAAALVAAAHPDWWVRFGMLGDQTALSAPRTA
jgi:4-diphosphocytidyl-2-C-methyl-D-erythritol kinase